MTVTASNIKRGDHIIAGRYGCRCCAWESQGRRRVRSAARRMIKRRERAAWKREAFG